MVQCKSIPFLTLSNNQQLAVLGNERNLRQAGLWDYLQKTWDDKAGLKNSLPAVAQFVASSEYCTGDEGQVDSTNVKFTFKEICALLNVPEGGLPLSQVEELKPSVIEQLFDDSIKKGKDGWNGTKARGVMSGWIPFISQRFFLNMDEKKIEGKQISAAWLAWNGTRLNWGEILIVSIRREVSRKKTRNPMLLLASGYLNVLCKEASDGVVNLAALPLNMKNPEGETSSPVKPTTKAGSSTPGTAFAKSKMPMVIVMEESEVLNDNLLDGAGGSGTNDNWAISHRGKKRPHADSITLTSDDSDNEDGEEEELPEDNLTNLPDQEDELSRLLQLKEQEINQLRQDLSQWQLKHMEASQREKGISLQLQDELKIKATLLETSNSLSDQLRDQELIFLREKENLSKARDEALKAAELMDVQRNRAEQYEILKREFDDQEREFHKLHEKYKESNAASTIWRKDATATTAKIKLLEEQLRTAKRPLSVHSELGTVGDYQPLELDTLQEEVRQMGITNDDLSNQLEVVTGQMDSLRTKVWAWEHKQPPSFSLYRSYELQRDLFLMMNDLTQGQGLDGDEFLNLWVTASSLKKENLLAEICIRQDLILQDFTRALISMGDIGARALLYYRDLEQQIALKRHIDHAVETTRQVDVTTYQAQLMDDFNEAKLDTEVRKHWLEKVTPLLQVLEDKEALGKTLSSVLERESWARRGELTNSHYIYTTDKAILRLQQTMDKLSLDLNPRINLGSMVIMAYSVRPYTSGLLVNVVVEKPSDEAQSSLKSRFLGKVGAVFETPEEREFSIPTWKALEWLVEDFGMTRTIRLAEDRQYQLISGNWPEGVPQSVTSDPRFCNCERRGKWAPDATIDSTNYNWPVIVGSFETWSSCAAAYNQHYELHKDHEDPVCFRSAVFARTIGHWCNQFQVKINVNRYDPVQPIFIFMLKLQYRCVRWKRILECMAITGFIAGVHQSFINETFHDTRRNPFSRFVEYQRTKNWSLVQEDEDVRKAVRKQQAEIERREVQQYDAARNLLRRR